MLLFEERASRNARNTAIVEAGLAYTYEQLLQAAHAVARMLRRDQVDLQENRIGYMVGPGFDYVRTQWGIWLAGGIAVPLCIDHPAAALRYTLTDSQVSLVIGSASYAEMLRPLADELGLPFLRLPDTPDVDNTDTTLPSVEEHRRAMILYTSGTTNLPKGVVSTHHNIRSQIEVLRSAWGWESNDHILCVLPLHHVHGIINVVNCALWSGATCEFLPTFSASGVVQAFLRGRINVFMAVPTIYYKLIAHYESLPPDEQQQISDRLRTFRLMVSGSAALPVSVMERWEEISGHRLLERYGMTEIGMALSNNYRGERYPGHVGRPLPGVAIRLRTEDNEIVPDGEAGEIQVKGPSVFLEYWNRPEATAAAFTGDGWFRTGDVARLDPERGFQILGRSSVDIIKSGGYKISALEIEEVLRRHPGVGDCAVVGVPNDEWGEVVAAALTPGHEPLDPEQLKDWLRDFLPGYKIPRQYISVPDLPRNAMGKVTKKEVVRLFE